MQLIIVEYNFQFSSCFELNLSSTLYTRYCGLLYIHSITQWTLTLASTTSLSCQVASVHVTSHTNGHGETPPQLNIMLMCVFMFTYFLLFCLFVKVKMWPMSDTGLLYDREWVIVGQNGAAITQKQNSKLCGIQTSIDLKEGVLTLSATSELQQSVFICTVCRGVCFPAVKGCTVWSSQIFSAYPG
jgi:hypothetical protein